MITPLHKQPKIMMYNSASGTLIPVNTAIDKTLYFGLGLDRFKGRSSSSASNTNTSEKISNKKRNIFYRSLLMPLLWISGIGGAGFLEFQALKHIECRDRGTSVLAEDASRKEMPLTDAQQAVMASLKTRHLLYDESRQLRFRMLAPNGKTSSEETYQKQIRFFQDAYDLNLNANAKFKAGIEVFANPIDIVIIEGLETFEQIGLHEKEVAAYFSFQHGKYMCEKPYIIALAQHLDTELADHEFIHFVDAFKSDFSKEDILSRDPFDRYGFRTILEQKDGFLPNMSQEEKDELTTIYNVVVSKMVATNPDSPVIEDQIEFLAYALSHYRSESLDSLNKVVNSGDFPLDEVDTIRDYFDRYFEAR